MERVRLTRMIGQKEVVMEMIPLQEDLCVIYSGGDKPHIGSVTLSVPRPSLLDTTKKSCTTSVLNCLGHKDDTLSVQVSEMISKQLGGKVACICGIHYDVITRELLQELVDATGELIKEYLQ